MVPLGKEAETLVLREHKGEASALPYLETASQRGDTDHLAEHRCFQVGKDRHIPGRGTTWKHKEQRNVAETDAPLGISLAALKMCNQMGSRQP